MVNTGAIPSAAELSIRCNLKPGDIGYITWLHGVLYAKEQGWDHSFEAYVAGPLAEFAKSGSPRQCIWIAEHHGTIVGSIAVVEASTVEAQLRWLLVDPAARGVGLGKRLVREAVRFAREQGYQSMFLWTVSELQAAAALYNSAGFKLTTEESHVMWGKLVTEQRYDLIL